MLDGRGSSRTYSIDHGGSVCTPRSMDASTSANAGNGRYQQHPAAELPQQQYAAAAPVPVAAIPVPTAVPYSSGSRQLRPPPVRYASSSAGTLPQHSHLKRTGRGYPADEATCTCVLPRTSVLCRLLVAMSILLVCVQAVSCGMFFCVRLPIIHSRGAFVEYQDLIADFSQPALSAMKQPAAQQTLQQPVSAVPKLVPRVIHQTYSNGHMPASAKSFMKSWAEVNGETWQVRFYSDDAAMTFVRREFPEYFEAYLHLPKDVERADFFRYMVVLRLGGAYADVDAECRQPLDSIIQPADTMLVGWDTEVSNATSAANSGLARQRLIANWFFVASAGHPVLRELCDHIARNAMTTFSNNTVRDTAERTGQAVWTDVVLRHALQHHAAKHDDPWKVRILPRVAFGVRPISDEPSLRPDSPGVVVLHHFMSSWQTARRRSLIQVLLSRDRPLQTQQIVEPVLASNITHYPVSIAFDPPFIFMTDLVGLGDVQATADVSATITAHGTWQPGIAPHRKPAVVEALVGALAKHSQRSTNTRIGGASHTAAAPTNDAAADAAASFIVVASAAKAATAHAGTAAEQAGRAAAADSSSSAHGSSTSSSSNSLGSGQGHGTTAATMQLRGGVLVDVGAGQGFFSLAAAARGHRVIAFEASPASLAAFKASVKYNGFQDLVTVHSTAVGASSAAVCLQQTNRPGCPATAAAAKLAGLIQSRHANDTRAGNRQHVQQEVQAAVADMQLRRRRGYPWVADGADLPPTHPCCRAIGRRVRLSDALQNATDVAALRISAHGHEAFVLQGALDYLRDVHKPDVVYVEFWPASLKAAGYQQPQALLDTLFGLGYTNIAHAGRVCDERWQNATQDLHLQGSYSLTAQKVLRQPTWCKLRPEHFNVLADAADASVPENLMFLLGQHDSAQQPSSPVDGKHGSDGRSSSRSDSSGTEQMSGSTNPGMIAHGGVGDSSIAVGQDSSSDAADGTRPVAELQQAAAGPGTAADSQRSEQVAPPPRLVLAGSTGISSADLQKPL